MGVDDLIVQAGRIVLWLQALGIIVILWIIFQLVQIWINRKRLSKIDEIKRDMKRIEGKIDKVLKN